jgi:hypothetical protein
MTIISAAGCASDKEAAQRVIAQVLADMSPEERAASIAGTVRWIGPIWSAYDRQQAAKAAAEAEAQ